jgi:hypothetical protein
MRRSCLPGRCAVSDLILRRLLKRKPHSFRRDRPTLIAARTCDEETRMGIEMYWETPATHEELSADEDAGHFRLSSWGLLRGLTLMRMLGMVDLGDEVETYLQAPRRISWDEALEIRQANMMNRPLELDEHSSGQDGDSDSGGVIPLYKLDSNRLLITSEEIERALASYDAKFPDREHQPRELPVPRENGDADVVDWWGDWIDWLRQAERRGGFRVC